MSFIEELLKQIQLSEEAVPYTIVNTLVYAALALSAVYLIYWLLKRIGVKTDSSFFYSIIPFVFFGSILRVLVDGGVVSRYYWFVTPGVYVLTAAFVLGVIFLSKFIEIRFKIQSTKFVKSVGWIASTTAFIPLVSRIKHLEYGVAIIFLALAGAFVFFLERRIRGKKIDSLSSITVFSQSLDGSASFVGVQFAGYVGQHVFEKFVFASFGPVFFFVLKVLFGIVFVEVVEKEFGKRELRNYLLLLITIFGLAPGVRDLLRIVCGT